MKFIVKKSFLVDNIIPILVGDIVEHHFIDDVDDIQNGIFFDLSNCYFFNSGESILIELSPTHVIEYLEYYKD